MKKWYLSLSKEAKFVVGNWMMLIFPLISSLAVLATIQGCSKWVPGYVDDNPAEELIEAIVESQVEDWTGYRPSIDITPKSEEKGEWELFIESLSQGEV